MGVSNERERTLTVLTVVLTLIGVAAYVAFDTGPLGTRLRGLAGVDDRLLAAVEEDGTGTYAFLETQRGGVGAGGGVEPVGFNPCRPLRYVVDPQGAPDDWEDLVEGAVAEVSARTGLELVYEGTTDDRDFSGRMDASGTGRPAIIAWADEDEVPELAGDVAGIGGATMIELGGRRGYVSGAVVLDTEAFAQLESTADADEAARALLLHELGHLVGLDHVDDRGELMYAEAIARASYGPGDREGLARLGAIPCR